MTQSKMAKFKMATMTDLRQLGLSLILCELFGLACFRSSAYKWQSDVFIESNKAEFNMAAMTHLSQLDLWTMQTIHTKFKLNLNFLIWAMAAMLSPAILERWNSRWLPWLSWGSHLEFHHLGFHHIRFRKDKIDFDLDLELFMCLNKKNRNTSN